MRPSRPSPHATRPAGVTSEVIIGSGKGVVTVPNNASGFDAAGRALIAWDSSWEAMKARQTSSPLLLLARTVTIVEESAAGP
jgi:hypothetical protein